MKKIIFAALLICTAIPSQLSAWGGRGHETVTYIAEQNLNKRAARAIAEVLDGRSIVYYASWMDAIRGRGTGDDSVSTWHYANVDQGYTYETMPREPKGDVVAGTVFVIDALKKGGLSREQEAYYLKLLVHMIGDLHCPMHAGRRSDSGGNRVQVRWGNGERAVGTNLHSVWDSRFLEAYKSWTYTEWGHQLNRLNKQQVRQIVAGTPVDWFGETVAASAKLYEYAEKDPNFRPRAYSEAFGEMLESHLQRGGYRLAAVLNEIYG